MPVTEEADMPGATSPAARGSRPLAVDVVQAYLTAWNAHDGAAVQALFDPAGTYVDPTLPGPIGGADIAGYVAGLTAAFPDLHFQVEAIAADGDRVTAQWRMQGTNTGLLPGAPEPSGGTCDLPGVDVITVGEAGIIGVVGYFDQKTFVEQLGLRAVVVPADEPPIVYGMSLRTDLGIAAVPGALTMTWIDVASDEESAEVQAHGTAILQGLATEPGFIGFVGTFSGARGHTLSAWTSPEAAESAMARSGPHRAAVERAGSGLGRQGFTSIWAPHRLNHQRAVCPTCHVPVDIEAGAAAAVCSCGAELGVTSYL
jgi:steroid delta-isomerase-like uncharacterized protein